MRYTFKFKELEKICQELWSLIKFCDLYLIKWVIVTNKHTIYDHDHILVSNHIRLFSQRQDLWVTITYFNLKSQILIGYKLFIGHKLPN